jgi:hypothetical protein
MPHARSSTRRHGRRPRSHRSAEGLRSCPERVASALNVDISLVRQKRDMLKGISPKPEPVTKPTPDAGNSSCKNSGQRFNEIFLPRRSSAEVELMRIR